MVACTRRVTVLENSGLLKSLPRRLKRFAMMAVLIAPAATRASRVRVRVLLAARIRFQRTVRLEGV